MKEEQGAPVWLAGATAAIAAGVQREEYLSLTLGAYVGYNLTSVVGLS